MSTLSLSLDSSELAGRIKKYDRYWPNARSARSKKKPIDGISNKVSRPIKPKLSQHNITSALKPISKPVKVHRSVSGVSSIRKATAKHISSNSNALPRRLKPESSEFKSTHNLALQAIGSTQFYKGTTIANQFYQVDTGHSKKHRLQSMFYVVAAIVFLFSSAVTVQTFTSNQQAKDQIQQVLGEDSVQTSVDEQGVVEGTGDQPTEKAVPADAIANYRVSNPEEPRIIRIPSIGVYARIKSLGVTREGAVDAPRNLNDVGWYDGSARPGNSRGSSLLLGHVSGWTADGVFKKISKLAPGTMFEVEKGNGTKVKYQVTRSESIPLDSLDMGKILTPDVEGEHDLKLMTCSGKYNRSSEEYEERLVVYAKVIR